MYTILTHTITTLQANLWYNIVITILATTSVLLLGLELWVITDPATVAHFHQIDIIIAMIFLTDFFAGLLFNQAQTRYEYWQRNWLNLISSVPISSELTQALRILRIWRAARIVRVSANFWFARTRLHDSRQHTTRIH